MAIQRRNDEMVALLQPDFPLGLVPIAQSTLAAPAASIAFSSIPQTFRSLLLVCQLRTDRAAENDGVSLRFNGDAGNNYDFQYLRANSATVTGVASRAQASIVIALCEAANSRASNWNGFEITIPGYALADREKWALCPLSAAFGNVSADADLLIDSRQGRWRSTAAITSITLLPALGANFAAGSVVALYGVM